MGLASKFIDATAKGLSGVQSRTLEANIGSQLKNGAFSSDRGFISAKQMQAKDNYLNYKEKGADIAKDSNDYLQTALHNLGSGVGKGSGQIGSAGYLNSQRPVLIMTIPTLSLPEDYGHYYGFPCNMTKQLSELSGFTVVKDCHLDGFSCTKTELDEIEALLKSGVII